MLYVLCLTCSFPLRVLRVLQYNLIFVVTLVVDYILQTSSLHSFLHYVVITSAYILISFLTFSESSVIEENNLKYTYVKHRPVLTCIACRPLWFCMIVK
jgi:hypothetical protein